MDSTRPLATRMILWCIKNYSEAKGFWIGSNWCVAIAIFIIGALKGYGLQVVVLGMLLVGLILNIGLYFAIMAARSHLKNLPEGPDKDEIHTEMIRFLMARIGKDS